MAEVPNPALVAATNLVVGNIRYLAVVAPNPAVALVSVPSPVAEMIVHFLLLPPPAQQGHTPLPAAEPVRNYRRMPPEDPGAPRIRDIRTEPEPWLRSGLRRTLCKRQRLPSPPHRIPGKTIASGLLHRPVGRRTPRKIPLRAGWGCRSWHRPVPPADALPVCRSYRKTPSLLKFPVHIPGNTYEPPVGMAADDNRLPVSIYAKTVISAALCHKV